MNEQDRTVISAGFLIAVTAGLWAHFMRVSEAVGTFIDFFLIVIMIGTVAVIAKIRDTDNSPFDRHLTIIGSGIGLYAVTYWFNYSWAAAGRPQLLGTGSHTWHLLFNALMLTATAVIAYGLHLFYQTRQEQ